MNAERSADPESRPRCSDDQPLITSASQPPARKRTRLAIEPARSANLRPFGDLLARPEGAGPSSDFYRGELTMTHPVRFSCDHPVELALATLSRREGEVRYLERHFAHTQTFIPLAGKPFVMVMAPPSQGEMPELSEARAFLFDGRQGFTLHLGTWHEFPFALLDETDIVVVLSSQTGYDLHQIDPRTREARGPDLDKKNIVERTGVVLTVDLDSALRDPHLACQPTKDFSS